MLEFDEEVFDSALLIKICSARKEVLSITKLAVSSF